MKPSKPCSLALALVAAVLISACAEPENPSSVSVSLERYAGSWFQVFEPRVGPEDAERGIENFEDAEGVDGDVCPETVVTYTAIDDTSVSLVNRCLPEGQDEATEITGTATAVNDLNNAFKVRFDPLYLRAFTFDYWILDVDDDYQLAVLGGSNPEDGITVLSRTPVVDPDLLAAGLEAADELGWDIDNRIATPQSAAAAD